MTEVELWGGHECTVNRVRNTYFDQTVRSGHHRRPEDLDLFAELGLKVLRYPVLWERVAPASLDVCNWHWIDQRLARMKSLGVRPIAGLVHHGAGPKYATLDTPAFAPGLAAFARAAAERYPWIDMWTPVNEPLTTARFSALYGHWYPHARDETAFWKVLLNEIDAIRLAMREIRRVNPSAKLVQTEDLGRTYSTPATSDQAAFDNARRWMTWDLLCGRVDSEHPLWLRISRQGMGDRLRQIADDPCPADIIGINHYLTSDRFLDDRTDRYPPAVRGGNRYLSFADVAAVRVMQPAPDGLRNAIEEAWERYRTPLAVTEVHNGCTREEQLRWLGDAWDTAADLKREGVDMRAVTVWSLLGAYDWDSLLTRKRGNYEPGVFDVRTGKARPTALAHLVKALATGGERPAECYGDGWWRRDVRLEHSPVLVWSGREPARRHARRRMCEAGPILITGATGTLGRMLARVCQWRDLDYVLTSRKELCLLDRDSITGMINRIQPRAVVNASGWVRVDDAEHERDACMAINTRGAVQLAEICAERKLPVVTFSTDLVFNGAKTELYLEDDACSPINVYGLSKRAAEEAILAMESEVLIVRTAAFFSPHDPYNFASAVVRDLRAGREFHAASDLVVSPTYVPDLANATLDLLIDRERGVWHLTNRGAVSWADFARLVARALILDDGLVVDRPSASFGWPARRPGYAALGSSRGVLLPALDHAIARYAAASPRAAHPEAPPIPDRIAATATL